MKEKEIELSWLVVLFFVFLIIAKVSISLNGYIQSSIIKWISIIVIAIIQTTIVIIAGKKLIENQE